MNLDTDMQVRTTHEYRTVIHFKRDEQYAFLTGIRDYCFSKKDYISTQVGNPEGEDKPNKKCVYLSMLGQKSLLTVPSVRFYDPRVWMREGEKTLCQRVIEALNDFNTKDQL